MYFSSGKFGACFIPGLCKQTDLTLFAARPGLRLWKSDVHGTVQATFILKDLFARGIQTFELYPRLEPPDRGGYSSPEKHLGLVSCFFREGWVLTWNEYSIYLLDTVNQVDEFYGCIFCFLLLFMLYCGTLWVVSSYSYGLDSCWNLKRFSHSSGCRCKDILTIFIY